MAPGMPGSPGTAGAGPAAGGFGVELPLPESARPVPREKRFSIKCWPTIRTDVKSRYQRDATISSGTGVNVTAEMPLDTP